MKALTNKVKSAYPMAKRFVKNTFGAYASTKSTFSSPSSKQKTVTGKIKSFFSPFDVQIGSTTSTTCSEHGNRKKRVVGYANFEMKAHIKTATTVVKKGVEQTEYVDLGVGGWAAIGAVAISVVIGDVLMILPVVPAW